MTPSDPAKLAPIAAPIAAISSSAWKVVTPYSLSRERWWRIAEAGRDRIAAEEHRQPGQLRARDEPERDRLGAGDGAVEAGLGRRGVDMVLA